MAERGAQPGNNNAKKTKPWRDALDRAIAQDNGKRLREAAEKVLTLAAEGESWAAQMLADRLDGKAHQSVILGEDADNPFVGRVERALVDVPPKPKDE